MKKSSDLSAYSNVLPYASEIFGVYQPLIGWKSNRILGRIARGFANDLAHAYQSVYQKFKGKFEFELSPNRALQQIRLVEPASIEQSRTRGTGSFVVDAIARQLPPLAQYDDAIWDQLLDAERLKTTLTEEVAPQTTEWYRGTADQERRAGRGHDEDLNGLLADQLNRESAIAGYMLYLKDNHQLDKLKQLFYEPDAHLSRVQRVLSFKDPLDLVDPYKDIDRASLSPIGIVHLFRQYFFEFDSFLGPPVSHVWLSPGATVELMEVSTRKAVVERTFESTVETAVKTEKTLTEEDELSDAVKEDNKSDTKFGMNATATQSWIGGSATASASLDMGVTQSKAREVTHRHMRQQTDKLSTEIRKNYKSTFRTVTEVTDTSSKRYVLSNTTENLINYEMRRKMRQVGVQVQDIGTYLCWQTFVDDPGRDLGISKMVHIAKAPEVASTPPPEAEPMPPPVVTQLDIDIPFVPVSEDALLDDNDAYRDGVEVETDVNEGEVEQIQADFGPYVMLCDQPDRRFDNLTWDRRGQDVEIAATGLVEEPPGKIVFNIHLTHIHFHENPSVRVTAKVTWVPLDSVIEATSTKNQAKMTEFNERTNYEFQKAFVDAARERIKLASHIEPRKFEDLREEERIVVYRRLIQAMLTRDIPTPDDRTRHTVAELLNTIFDVEKMLYFVAPEYWRPRLHQSHQGLGGIRKPSGATATAPSPDGGAISTSVYQQLKAGVSKNVISTVLKGVEDTQIAPIDTVTWGGTHENRVDNYYITEESAPAKLGSSLGWLLQLDGDNMRNAFLNAPWVKAVIPIRPGKERAAMNWLQRVHVEGTDGLDAVYAAPAEELDQIPHPGQVVTIRDAINHLCDVVAQKHEDSMKVDRYPTEEINDDNRVSATPVDKVYEHGFYPLQGGFRVLPGTEAFEVFDQWVEILPTDQVVPVEVTYDPITGRQI